MRISDWSSDVCSSDLCSGKSSPEPGGAFGSATITGHGSLTETTLPTGKVVPSAAYCGGVGFSPSPGHSTNSPMIVASATRASEVSRKNRDTNPTSTSRSEEHTSELQSLMRISYAVFCLKTNTKKKTTQRTS